MSAPAQDLTGTSHAKYDPEVLKKAQRLLSAGRLRASEAAPYFRPMLLSLVMRHVPGFRTIGVTRRAICFYGEEFIARQTANKVAGLLLHECDHLLHKHAERRGTRDQYGWNVAGDRAINPSILKLGLELPDGRDTGCFPKDLGMADGLSADEYYRADPSGDKGKGGGKHGPTGGECGGCSGNPMDGEPDDTDDQANGRTDAELGRATRQTCEAICEAAASKGRGSVPGEWLRLAELELAPARIPWAQRLGHSLRSASSYRPGAVTHRYDGPSRKQASVGYGTGLPILPRLRMPVPNVMVAIDTSGSMGTVQLVDACNETNGILKALGAAVTLCTCDAAVHGLTKVKSVTEVLHALKGGGGTDFVPVFDAALKLRPRPEVLVFVTDGDGRYPEAPPPGIRVIWLVVGRYRRTPPWGEVIEYDGEHDADDD